MKKVLGLVAVLSGIVLMAGCYESEVTARYASLTVPEYSAEDYHKLLSDKNPEVVYNTLCNLLGEASSMARRLSDEKADKTSKEYALADGTRKKVLDLLRSRNEKVLSASLRFMELFGANYSKKDELIGPVQDVKAASPNAQFEEIMALTTMTSKESKVDAQALKGFLSSRSWLVSRGSYWLVNSLEDAESRTELIKRYGAATSQMEKLLILIAMRKNFSNEVFGFLAGELLSIKDAKIRNAIFKMLAGAKNTQVVLGWIERNYARLSKEDVSSLVDIYYERAQQPFNSALLVVLLKKGAVPEDKFFEKIHDLINYSEDKDNPSEEDKQSLANLMKIRDVISASPTLNEKWLAMEKGLPEADRLDSEMVMEYNTAADIFISAADEILKKYDIKDEKREKFIEDISALKGYLREGLSE